MATRQDAEMTPETAFELLQRCVADYSAKGTDHALLRNSLQIVATRLETADKLSKMVDKLTAKVEALEAELATRIKGTVLETDGPRGFGEPLPEGEFDSAKA